ncbi:YvrJ family protein [Romboutsia ilealis]|uniref:YvrJ family protein n=1 Tax=Romboutsia ilealis TaxID=1115758 RepID=UPI003AB99D5A
MCFKVNSELQTLIASVGFPIALSMYLLVRIEGKLQTLSDSINELSKNIIRLK